MPTMRRTMTGRFIAAAWLCCALLPGGAGGATETAPGPPTVLITGAIRTKEEAGRDKDRAVLELLRQALRGSAPPGRQ
jgi:hypothetical protein